MRQSGSVEGGRDAKIKNFKVFPLKLLKGIKGGRRKLSSTGITE